MCVNGLILSVDSKCYTDNYLQATERTHIRFASIATVPSPLPPPNSFCNTVGKWIYVVIPFGKLEVIRNGFGLATTSLLILHDPI